MGDLPPAPRRRGGPSPVASGQSTLSILLGAHRWLGAHDGELAQRLVDAGASVNYRERRGRLAIHLAALTRAAADEDRRQLYAEFLAAHPASP